MSQELFSFVFLAPRVLILSCEHYYPSENMKFLVPYQTWKIGNLYIGSLKYSAAVALMYLIKY